jgi:hypothetical protein
MATDLLTTIRREIAARLSELGPSLREYQELISAEHALTGGPGGAAAAARGGAARGRATRAAAKPARARRAGATRAGATPAKTTRGAATPAGAKPSRATPAKTTRGAAARGGAAKATATSAASSAPARSAAAAVAAAPVAAAPADAEGGPRRRYSRPGIRRRAADADAASRSGAGATTRSRSGAASPTGTGTAAKPRADVTEQAILAALEHGSHTTAELVTVTALSAQSIRRSLTRLERVGTIGRTRRDGRTAYLLSAGSA